MYKTTNQNKNISIQGSILVYTIVIIFIFSLVMLGLLGYATMQLRLTRSAIYSQQAFQIAEAGINYYEWRLAKFPADFWDGNSSTTPGSYVHKYIDKTNGQAIGQFTLDITPPPVGSTIATIVSTGFTYANPNEKRKITARYGISSLAQYAFLTNSTVWVGSGETINGEMRANGGVRFDGSGNAPISSAKDSYTCPAAYGSPCPAVMPGIWGAASTSTVNHWQFPVPNFDFNTITPNLTGLKATAQTDGGAAYLSPSNKQGYSFVFTANGKVDIYLVKKVLDPPAQAWDVDGNAVNTSADYDQRQMLYSQIAFPPSGVFYVEDNVWVEGVVNGRVMLVAAKLQYNAATAPKLFIANNLTYSSYNGGSILGLLGQKDIIVSYNAPSDLRLDAALIAQNGSVQAYQYQNNTNIKNTITVFGSIISYGQWAWSYIVAGNVVSGFRNASTTYDTNLLYYPPPSFPITSFGYQQLSWVSN